MGMFPLASEFPPAGRQDWLARVEAVLARQQSSFEALRWVSDDGIAIEPLYERAAAAQRCERSAPDGRWVVMQRVDHPVPATANELALDDVRGGATGLAVTFSGAASAHGFGLAENDPRSIAGALRNVELHALSLRLELGPDARGAVDAMRELVAARSLNPEAVRLSFGMESARLAGDRRGVRRRLERGRPTSEPTRRRSGERVSRAVPGSRRPALS